MQASTRKILLPATLALLALAACSEREGKPASQLAAKVNEAEISVHQVNHALRNQPFPPPGQLEASKRRVLDELVDQELAMQQAIAGGLDRKPEILLAVEAARREILAAAYLDQISARAPAPGVGEIADYYREHPELFAARKVYQLSEATLEATPEALAAIHAELARGRDATAVAAWAKGRRLPVEVGPSIRPAERIELEFLPRLAQMREGESAFFESDGKATVVTLLGATTEPLGEPEARPLIENFLRRQRGESIARETARKLRSEARIEYLGEFSEAAVASSREREEAAERERRAGEAAREAARRQQAEELATRRAAARQSDAAAESPPPAVSAPPPQPVLRKGMADFK